MATSTSEGSGGVGWPSWSFEGGSWLLHNRNLQLCNMTVTMATRAPARMPAEARREQLLDVTKAIVAERGFHAVSIEGVAREAGISRPIVYGHFDDLPGPARRARQARGRPRARPARGGAAAGARARRPRGAARGRARRLPRGGAGRPGDVAARARPARGRARRAARGDLARARGGRRPARRGAGRRRARAGAPDPELAAHLLSALADEAARLLLADPDRYPPERVLALARWFLGADGSVRVTLGPARCAARRERRAPPSRWRGVLGFMVRRAAVRRRHAGHHRVLRLRDHPRAAAGALPGRGDARRAVVGRQPRAAASRPRRVVHVLRLPAAEADVARRRLGRPLPARGRRGGRGRARRARRRLVRGAAALARLARGRGHRDGLLLRARLRRGLPHAAAVRAAVRARAAARTSSTRTPTRRRCRTRGTSCARCCSRGSWSARRWRRRSCA